MNLPQLVVVLLRFLQVLVVDVANFPNRMMVTLDDGTSRIEVSANHERFMRFKDIIQNEKVVVIEGEIYEREGFDRPMGRLTKAFTSE